jgi:ABC-type multidrug transport system fused ATPase/permease subunit
MIMAFTVDVKAALVFVVTIPLLSIVVFGVMLLCMPRFKKVQQGLDAILGRTRENLAGARVIRAFNKEEEEVASFGEENERLTNMQLLVGRISALTNPLTYIIINAAIIAVIWIGGNRVYGGYITQGAVVALVNYMSQILVELVKLANLIVNITKSLACANRIAEVLALESTLKEPETDGAADAGRSEASAGDAQGSAAAGIAQSSADSRTDSAAAAAGDARDSAASGDTANGIRVRFDHVSMTYAGASEEALKDIDFQAKAGQTIGIIGGTGSGKSSLVHLIPRFYDVSAGAVYVDGKDVRDYSLTALRDKVGMVMQKAVLFSGTIAENLRWGNENATEEEMWHALDIAQATDVVKSKKEGLASKIEEGGKNLSGGQKQRLTIARAVVKNPDILILDDSASALDFATDAKLRAALRRLQAEGSMTVFIVSQRTSSIRFADQIIVLDDGIAVGIGTHDELLQNCEIYREIYDSQFKKEGGSHAE